MDEQAEEDRRAWCVLQGVERAYHEPDRLVLFKQADDGLLALGPDAKIIADQLGMELELSWFAQTPIQRLIVPWPYLREMKALRTAGYTVIIVSINVMYGLVKGAGDG